MRCKGEYRLHPVGHSHQRICPVAARYLRTLSYEQHRVQYGVVPCLGSLLRRYSEVAALRLHSPSLKQHKVQYRIVPLVHLHSRRCRAATGLLTSTRPLYEAS